MTTTLSVTFESDTYGRAQLWAKLAEYEDIQTSQLHTDIRLQRRVEEIRPLARLPTVVADMMQIRRDRVH